VRTTDPTNSNPNFALHLTPLPSLSLRQALFFSATEVPILVMGKTNPTYRDLLAQLRENQFRRGLRRRYQASYDEVLRMADERAHAGGLMHGTETNPHIPILWSIIVTQQHRLEQLEDLVEDVVDDDGESRLQDRE
jgi:hypothetical protein